MKCTKNARRKSVLEQTKPRPPKHTAYYFCAVKEEAAVSPRCPATHMAVAHAGSSEAARKAQPAGHRPAEVVAVPVVSLHLSRRC
jgi:hypothetical protein